MAQAEFCQLYLTCANTVEAGGISDTLLEKRLVVCSKQMPVNSHFLWKGSVDQNSEVMLIMDSRLDLFTAIEAEVTKLHSYETFVLEAVPIIKLSAKAKKWMQDELK